MPKTQKPTATKGKPQAQHPAMSIVMVACEGVNVTSTAIQSIRRCFKLPYELIVIDNATTDGTTGYLKGLPYVKTIRSDELISYGAALNKGLKETNPNIPYLCITNNDVEFIEGWDVMMMDAFNHPELVHPHGVPEIGIVGTLSNAVAGRQNVNIKNYKRESLESIAKDIRMDAKKRELPRLTEAGFLSGFCWVMSRKCYETVGDIEEFYPGGYEDNDYVHRSRLAGFFNVIDQYNFTHHDYSSTFFRLGMDWAKRGLVNRFNYYNKWKEPSTSKLLHKKLVAGYRIKNVSRYFERVLTKMCSVANEIVIFDDNSTDNSLDIAKKVCEKHDIPLFIHKQTETVFNEARDRNLLIQYCKERNPDWIMINDGDEELEEKFTKEAAQKLMNPLKPNIYAYNFRYVTFWDSEKTYRKDGIFGGMQNIRMFRNLPNQFIKSEHPQGFHCNSVPWFARDMVHVTPYRIKHYGYLDPAERQRKFEWYEKMDTDKRAKDIGQENYSHLVDINVKLGYYQPNLTIGLIMIAKDEEENLEVFLDEYYNLFDEMVIVDTGSKDRTKEIAEYYGAKVYDFEWNGSFSDARNFSKSKCTAKWCFQIDPDERIQTKLYMNLYFMIEEPVMGYIIPKVNLLPGNDLFISESCHLFKNLPELYYSGDLHESICDSMEGVHGHGKIIFVSSKDEALLHYAYLKDPKVLNKKLNTYASMCNKMLAKNPNDYMAHFSLGLHYQNLGDIDKAEYHLKQAIIHNPRFIQASKQLGFLKLKESRKVLEMPLKYFPENHPMRASVERIVDTIKPFTEDLPPIGIMDGRGIEKM